MMLSLYALFGLRTSSSVLFQDEFIDENISFLEKVLYKSFTGAFYILVLVNFVEATL